MKQEEIQSLYYITHKDNLKSILEHGIYSHNKIESEGLKVKKIYDKDVINIRKDKKLPNGDNLPDYSNFYFNPRNPMMYRVLHEKGKGNFQKGTKYIVILEIKKEILSKQGVYIATGNAATYYAEFLAVETGIKKLDKKILFCDYWTDMVDGKSKIMAEALVKEKIKSDDIVSIYTGNHDLKQELENKYRKKFSKINFICDKTKFFLPNRTYKINEKINLVEGDMFLSQAKILTISVNTVGIMGKGLASRAKYQFPDVYVQYQDLCRSKKLSMGKPYLMKREKSIDDVLSYQPETLKNKNSHKWFLLFPTKNHWKNNSDFKGIEQGLNYLLNLSQKEKLESIALPALGCGLGNLSWERIGPLMCQYLNQMENIKFVSIYLPMGQEIKQEFLQPNFLLKERF